MITFTSVSFSHRIYETGAIDGLQRKRKVHTLYVFSMGELDDDYMGSKSTNEVLHSVWIVVVKSKSLTKFKRRNKIKKAKAESYTKEAKHSKSPKKMP